jgi:hypothetical protein
MGASRAVSVLLRHVRQPQDVAAALAAIRRMPRVSELRFEDSGLTSLGFIDQIAGAGFGGGNGQLVRLHVGASNPAATLALLRPYAAHRLPSLDVINNVVRARGKTAPPPACPTCRPVTVSVNTVTPLHSPPPSLIYLPTVHPLSFYPHQHCLPNMCFLSSSSKWIKRTPFGPQCPPIHCGCDCKGPA